MSKRNLILGTCLVIGVAAVLAAASGSDVQQRMTADAAAGKVLVAHVVVALCDNRFQGIVPVPQHLGDGQDPCNNLYWGAAYGVRTYLARRAGWRLVAGLSSPQKKILERIVLHAKIERFGRAQDVYIVADAWDGSEIKASIGRFLEMAAGRAAESVEVRRGSDQTLTLPAGGAAHVVAFVGHNGLMDFSLSGQPGPTPGTLPRSSLVLSCASKPYFAGLLDSAGSHRLLLTTGLMAPEAYTLDAALRAWFSGASPSAVHEAAAAAYHKYQKCGNRAAKRLFWIDDAKPGSAGSY